MNTIINIIRDFSNTIMSSFGPILLLVSLLVIFAIILFIGWRVNRPRSYNVEAFLGALKASYDGGKISKKEYEDIKREMEEPLNKLKYYSKMYE